MSTSATAQIEFTKSFDAISLEELNAKADMLRRLDNKYVVESHVLDEAMMQFSRHFNILEIDGRRSFTYDTCYFDSSDLGCYADHHRGRRKRAKVRVRNYVDSDLCFVEVKLKDKRGVTTKKRLPYDASCFGELNGRARHFVQTCYRSLYGDDFPYDLRRALDMQYQRITLVAKAGGERMTIDNGLVFKRGNSLRLIDPSLFIVETKSANGNGIADKILRALHRHPTKHCSKYCAATAMLDETVKTNNFRVVMGKLGGSLAPALAPPLQSHDRMQAKECAPRFAIRTAELMPTFG